MAAGAPTRTINRGYVVRRVGRGARRMAAAPRHLTRHRQPRRTWVRVLGGAGSLFLLVVTFMVLGLLSVASAEGGWLPAAVWFLPAVLLGTLTVGIGRWYAAIALSIVGAVLLGVTMYHWAIPEPERIATVAEQVGVPEGWQPVGRELNGNTWCLWNDCPEFYAVYATTQSAEQARDGFTRRLEAEGWEREEDRATWREDPENHQWWHDGRWHVTLNVAPAGSPGRAYDSEVAKHLTKVTLTYDAGR